jgi:hypothetical protein
MPLDMTLMMRPFFWVAVVLIALTPGLIALARRHRQQPERP